MDEGVQLRGAGLRPRRGHVELLVARGLARRDQQQHGPLYLDGADGQYDGDGEYSGCGRQGGHGHADLHAVAGADQHQLPAGDHVGGRDEYGGGFILHLFGRRDGSRQRLTLLRADDELHRR